MSVSLNYRGGCIAASTQEDLDRFIVNDVKIRAGQCPNNCGPMREEMHGGLIQICPECKFCTNTLKEEP